MGSLTETGSGSPLKDAMYFDIGTPGTGVKSRSAQTPQCHPESNLTASCEEQVTSHYAESTPKPQIGIGGHSSGSSAKCSTMCSSGRSCTFAEGSPTQSDIEAAMDTMATPSPSIQRFKAISAERDMPTVSLSSRYSS